MIKIDNAAIDALAESWASIDGKTKEYNLCRDYSEDPISLGGGYYDGYQIEAAEMIVRLRRRGFDVTPMKSDNPTELSERSPGAGESGLKVV